jgi:hypothetical protein
MYLLDSLLDSFFQPPRQLLCMYSIEDTNSRCIYVQLLRVCAYMLFLLHQILFGEREYPFFSILFAFRSTLFPGRKLSHWENSSFFCQAGRCHYVQPERRDTSHY